MLLPPISNGSKTCCEGLYESAACPSLASAEDAQRLMTGLRRLRMVVAGTGGERVSANGSQLQV